MAKRDPAGVIRHRLCLQMAEYLVEGKFLPPTADLSKVANFIDGFLPHTYVEAEAEMAEFERRRKTRDPGEEAEPSPFQQLRAALPGTERADLRTVLAAAARRLLAVKAVQTAAEDLCALVAAGAAEADPNRIQASRRTLRSALKLLEQASHG